MKHFTVVFVIILLAGSVSCTKKKDTAVYLNKDVKDYFNYQPGTYWTFYDSENGNKRDSLYVVSNVDYPPFWDYKTATETHDLDMKNSLDSLEWDLSIDVPDITEINIVKSLVNPGVTIPITRSWPFFTGTTTSFGQPNGPIHSGSYSSTFFSTYSFGGIVYNDVYKIKYELNNGYDIFYINQEQGFLSIELNDQYFHKYLNLTGYKIVTK